ncbi:helix-turn-helix domain-containing protein [Bacillus sp. MUM 116]|uniref:helix-turn-helix domain-containing protein n=1 Tax=Bacillus sp. MUM 116 TaxID=1678002 RepID=UPI000A830F28|nr:helix-turn-helix domain-containing protein [Bacillus sp. MUM 116]
MQSLENIILYCLKQLNGERTIYSIYHLLNGKKSSQTIQDAHLYSLKKFFRIIEPLTREFFDTIVQRIFKKGWISKISDHQFLITASGEDQLKKHSLPRYLNGWEYQHLTNPFWERLSLLVQVISNLVYQENRYIPIQKNKDAHLWLKKMIKSFKRPRDELGRLLLSEVTNALERSADIEPEVVIYRLTGYRQIGLTAGQTAKMLKMENLEYHIEFINIIHFLIQTIETDSKRYPLLSSIFQGLRKNDSLTISARKTWDLLNKGFSIDDIVKLRHLKQSTIEDHLVEFALNLNEFSIETYVDKELQNKIINLSIQLQTRQLKLIRNSLSQASYFQIRLVLAKYGELQWN